MFVVNLLNPSDLAIQAGSNLVRPAVFNAELKLEGLFDHDADSDSTSRRRYRALKLLFGPALSIQAFFANKIHLDSDSLPDEFCETVASKMFADLNQIRSMVKKILSWDADPNQGLVDLLCFAAMRRVDSREYEDDVSFSTFVSECSSCQFLSQSSRVYQWLGFLV